MRSGRTAACWAARGLLLVVACEAGPRAAEGEAFSALDSLHAHGESLYSDGEIDSARVVFGRELALARSRGDSLGAARALTWLSQAAWRLGDYGATKRLGEEALAIKLRLGGGDLFRSYNVLGLLAWNEARPLDAVELFEKATAAAEATGDSANLAKVWNNRGLVSTSLGHYEEARAGFQNARQTARAIGDPLIEGRSLINLAMLALEVGDPLAAMDHLAEARPLLVEAEDVVGEQILLGHLGTSYAATGNPGRAIAHLDSALQRSRRNGLRQEEAINLEQLAELHRDAGNPRRALELLARAGRINEEMGLIDEQGIDLRNEARIHRELGNRRVAIDKARRALAIHQGSGAALEELSDLIVLAELSGDADSFDEAHSYLEEAERLAATLGVRSGRVEVALGRARVADRAEESSEVLRVLEKAQDEIRQLGYGVEWEAEALRARALARAGRLEHAARAGRRAIEGVERVRGEFASGWLREAYLRGREAVYGELVDTLLRLGSVQEALQVSDASRGRVLLEHATAPHHDDADGGTRDPAESERLLWRIHELSERLDEVDHALIEEPSRDLAKQADLLGTELEWTRAEYHAALLRAEEHGRRTAALSRSPKGDDRRRLAPGEALLEYLILPDRLILFVVDRDTIVALEQEITRDELTTRLRVARELTSRASVGAGVADLALGRLHELLIRPALDSGALDGIERLVIVPHAELEYLPFPALRDLRTGRFLVEDYVLAHAPSLGTLALLREQGSRTPRAGPRKAIGLAPFPEGLPASLAELDALRRALPRADVHRGRAATERRFRDALQRPGIVHVASHGILNARNPMFSRIELSTASASGGTPPWRDDGRLEVHEVLAVPVRSEFVFLSGCETGVGPSGATGYDRGRDYSTLAQAFLSAGAGSVVATLWRVEDRSAAIFAERFYRAYRRRPEADALALAQRSMIADPRHRDPYRWAGYRISGR